MEAKTFRGAPSTELNPFLRDSLVDPFPLYAELRALGPVVWLEQVGVWGLFRDEQCREILTDWQNFGSAGGGGLANYYREKPWRSPSVVFEVDPPDHTRTRRVLSRILSPRTVRALEESTKEIARDVTAKAVAVGEIDAIGDWLKPVVMKVVPDAVGLPQEDRENLLAYNKYLLKGRGFNRHAHWTDEELAEAEAVTQWVEMVCQRDSIASDGLGAQIYEAHDRGEISEYEANMLIRSFLSAGTDTTFGSIANTILFLMQNRGEWEKLLADPGKARNAYEEGLRFRSPAQIVPRNTMAEMEYHGAEFGQHDKVVAFVGSANRDPARWEDPDRFDIDRKTTGHLGLGTGIHGCVGQMIARMEASLLLEELARQAVDVVLGPEKHRLQASGRGLETLPITITGRG